MCVFILLLCHSILDDLLQVEITYCSKFKTSYPKIHQYKRSAIVILLVYFQYFQKDLPEILEHDPEQLFNLAFSMKINAKQMKKWEKEYAAVRKKEQEEMGELRVRPPKFNNLRTG